MKKFVLCFVLLLVCADLAEARQRRLLGRFRGGCGGGEAGSVNGYGDYAAPSYQFSGGCSGMSGGSYQPSSGGYYPAPSMRPPAPAVSSEGYWHWHEGTDGRPGHYHWHSYSDAMTGMDKRKK